MVCGGHDSRLLHTLRFVETNYPGDFAVRECAGCGLLFNSPRLADAQIEQMYDGTYYVFREAEQQALKRVQRLAAQTIGVAQRCVGARELLEVGCAKGYMLALLRAHGWMVRGVEVSPQAAAFARERFGLPVFTGTLQHWLDAADFAPAAVTLCTDVVEHVTDPPAFVAQLYRATAAGGWLIIGTPNADSEHRRVQAEQWLGFNPFHIFLFNRAALARLLGRAGFELVESYTFANGAPPAAPLSSGLRAHLRGLLGSAGLLAPARRARDALTALAQPRVTAQMLHKLVTAGGPDLLGSYLCSADGEPQRRRACRGDNLVIIARRRP